MIRQRILCVLLMAAATGWSAENFDLVVYGATGGGVITAVAGGREGLKVALLEPGNHIGGSGANQGAEPPRV